MKKRLFTLFVAFCCLACLLAVTGYGIYRYGSVSGLVQRVEAEIAGLRPKEPVIVPTFVAEATVDTGSFLAEIAAETPTAISTPVIEITPIPTESAVPTLKLTSTTMPTAAPTETPAPTATPNYDPAVSFVNLTGYQHNWQTWNNCGPATIATYLSYLGKGVTQVETAAVLKPNEKDKNVRVDEIVAYVEGRFPDLVVTHLINGSPETLKLLLSNGYPVMLQTWLEEDPDDGMGHFRFLVGYDEGTAEWIVSDSYVSAGVNSPYAGIRVSNKRFIDHWSVFDNNYILIHRPEDGLLIDGIIGEDLNPEVNFERAFETYSLRLQSEPDNPFVWHTMGDLLLADGRPEQAVQAYDQARTIGLPWRMFWYSFGVFEAYAEVGRYAELVELADATIDSGGAGEEIYYWKGVGHQALGEQTAADDAFRQALWWNPTHLPSQEALSG